MKINKLDHISIAVENLDGSRKAWETLLGKAAPDDSYVDENECIKVARYWVGEVAFELMESTTPDGHVAEFIRKHGEGVMVVSFNVDNTRDALQELQGKGYPIIPSESGDLARAFRNCEFAFVHPKKLNGVLTEIIDDKSSDCK